MNFFQHFFLCAFLFSLNFQAFSLSQEEKDQKLFIALSELPSRMDLSKRLGYGFEKVYPKETWVKPFWKAINEKKDQNILNYFSYYLKTVKEALDLGANPNTRRLGINPLYIAVTKGFYDIVELLLAKNARMDDTYTYRSYENTGLMFILLDTIAEEALAEDDEYRRIFLLLLNSGLSLRDGTVHQKPIHLAALIHQDSFYLKHFLRNHISPWTLDAEKKNVFSILDQIKKDGFVTEEESGKTFQMVSEELAKARAKKRS